MSFADQETPLASPVTTVENWSENFCLSSFDPASGIGLWLHLGRWRHRLDWWREMFVLMLPDGTVCAHRAIGNQLSNPEGPGGPAVSIRVEEPRRRLSYRFSGGARRLPHTEMQNGLLRDGPRVPLQFDLRFESTLPMWDLHEVGDRQDFLGRGHVEQLGRLAGAIEIGGRRINYSGMANRDHSMGPRDTSAVSAHHWMQGQFDNGIGFLVYDAVLRGHPQPVFSEALVYDGAHMHRAQLNLVDRIADPAEALRPIAFDLIYERGTLKVLVEHMANTAYLSYSAPNDMWLGVYPQPSGEPLTLLEQSALLSLDGRVSGHGHIERTVPGDIEKE